MKLLIAGSRSILNYDLVAAEIDALLLNVSTVVQGGAAGVDELAKEYAVKNSIDYKQMDAEWELYGKKAGMLRNKQMATECDNALIFWDGVSSGTQNMIEELHELSKPYQVFKIEPTYNFDLNPDLDGKTHINIYSKGRTELGKFLSNFSECKIDTPEGKFNSIEGYWYYISTENTSLQKNLLRNLVGYQAKELGKKLTPIKDYVYTHEFQEKIKTAINKKLTNNADLLKKLRETTLPLTHYYVWNNKVYLAGYYWIIQHLNSIRENQINI